MYKAPYYPHLMITQTETRFGAIETNNPQLYLTPLKNRIILQIDTLVPLKELWGDNILMSRNLTYNLVSGSCDDKQYRDLLQSYYKKFAAFTNYVNYTFLFGDTDVPEIRRLIKPIREIIDSYSDDVIREIKATGGKFLMRTHDYVYCAYTYEPDILKDKKVVRIC